MGVMNGKRGLEEMTGTGEHLEGNVETLVQWEFPGICKGDPSEDA